MKAIATLAIVGAVLAQPETSAKTIQKALSSIRLPRNCRGHPRICFPKYPGTKRREGTKHAEDDVDDDEELFVAACLGTASACYPHYRHPRRPRRKADDHELVIHWARRLHTDRKNLRRHPPNSKDQPLLRDPQAGAKRLQRERERLRITKKADDDQLFLGF